MNLCIEELPLWGHSLVETEKGTLIWIGSRSDTRLLVFEFDAFNPEISTFALTIPAVPQFIYQCLAWFEAGIASLQPLLSQESGPRHAFRTGEQVRIALTREGRTLHVQKPDKTTVVLDNPIFAQTDQVGVYTLLADDQELERFTVNLLDAAESALPHSTTESIIAEVPSGCSRRIATDGAGGMALVCFCGMPCFFWWSGGSTIGVVCNTIVKPKNDHSAGEVSVGVQIIMYFPTRWRGFRTSPHCKV